MELRHLRYFVAVAEELHFGRAAERLHLAQQPLSRQIRNLEAELDVVLFYRTKRTVQLTQAGQAFLPEARKTLAQAKQAAAIAQRVSRGEAGHLRVGFTGPMLNRVLPTLVRQLTHRYPDIHLDLQRLTTAQQVSAILHEEIHVGLLHPPIETLEIEQDIIYQEPLVAALPDRHPLAQDAPQPLMVKHLAHEPFILFPRPIGPVLYDAIVGFCQHRGFTPHVVQEAFPQQTILGLVAAGLGVSLIHASVQQIQQQGMVTRPLVEPTPMLSSAIAWHSHIMHPVVPQLRKLVKDFSQNL